MQVLGAAFNDNARQHLPEFIKLFRPTFPIGIADRLAVNEYMQMPVMSPGYVPFLMFIDPKFTVRAQYTGEQPFFTNEAKNIRDMLDSLLKETGGASGKKAAPAKKRAAKK